MSTMTATKASNVAAMDARTSRGHMSAARRRRRRLGLRSLIAVPALATAGLLVPVAGSTARPFHTGSVCHSALPPQAGDTLRLIAQGGPYPYPQDGEVFQNREGVLR